MELPHVDSRSYYTALDESMFPRGRDPGARTKCRLLMLHLQYQEVHILITLHYFSFSPFVIITEKGTEKF